MPRGGLGSGAMRIGKTQENPDRALGCSGGRRGAKWGAKEVDPSKSRKGRRGGMVV